MLPRITKEMVQAMRREMAVQPESTYFNEINQHLEKNDTILAQFIDMVWMENGSSPKLRRGLLGIYQILASQSEADKISEWFKK